MGKTVRNAFTRINFLRNLNGFTLVELLVVIAIMALIGVYILANYGTFGEDQKLKNAALDVVSLLRQAQTNATTNVGCAGTWQVEFLNTTTINLKCVSTQKSLTQYTYTISGTNALNVDCSVSLSDLPKVNFTPISGKVSLIGGTDCTSFTVTLTKGTNSKTLKIEQGGRIYAQ